MKTNELTGAALDWAVAKCEGRENDGTWDENFSSNWLLGGPIIERECMEFDYDEESQVYTAANGVHAAQGKTHLIAAMRCYVASRLGDEVDVPEELN